MSEVPAAGAARGGGALLPVLILLGLGVTWGGLTNVAKYVGQQGVPALSYTFWTTCGAALLLLAVNLVRRRRPPLTRRYLLYYLMCGATSSAIPTSVMFWTVRHIPAGQMAMVLATAPLITYTLALLVRMEPFRASRAGGIALGFAGALLLVLPRGAVAGEGTPYLLIAFLTPFFYSVGSLLAARLQPPESDSLVLATGMMAASASFLLVAVMFSEPLYPLWRAEGSALVNALIGLHMFSAGFAFALFFFLLKVAGPVYFSQVAYLVTLFGIAFGVLVFDERHPPTAWVALACIFGGLALVNRRGRRGDR